MHLWYNNLMYIQKLLAKEKSHFYRLSIQAQQLLKTIALYELIAPLLGIFVTAFLWRSTHDITTIVGYYVLFYLGIPIGFYINGMMLRKFTANKLSSLGMLLMGGFTTLLLFVPSLTFWQLCLFGFVNGFAVGIFWANRNLLTLKTTTSETRIYFSGIESIVSTSCKILVPFLIGWLIVFGSKTGWYTELAGYKLAGVLMLFCIFSYGMVMNSFSFPHVVYKQLFLHNISGSWRKFQYL